MESLVSAPILIPLVTAMIVLPLGRKPRLQSALSITGGFLSFLASLAILDFVWEGSILVLRVGGWGAQAGIVWLADGLSALILAMGAGVVLALLTCVRAGWFQTPPPASLHPLVHLLAMGVQGALLTADFFNLFVFYEVMLLASFALIVAGEGKGLNQALPYVLVNLVASLVFLVAVGIIYGLAGTVSMAGLARHLSATEVSAPLWAAIGLMVAVFAIKAAIVPVFVWLPDSYPAAPLTITALFAGLLTKVGVYTLLRSVPLLVPPGDAVYTALLWLGVATMVVGVLGALGRRTIRGILSFHIISQVGYLVFGLGLGTTAALAAVLLFTVHNMAVKPALILAGGVAGRLGGSEDLAVLGGLSRRPWVAAAFFIPAMALAGLPPLSGFWGKVLLVRAGFATQAWVASAVAIAVSFFTLASMLKIWSAVYWGERHDPAPKLGPDERRLVGAALGLTAVAVGIGLAISRLLRFAESAAHQVLSIQPYLDAVLGGRT